jgi:HAMP domain-containing protein
MKLIVKFNLVLSAVFVVAFVLAGVFTHALLQRNAKAEIEENARIMIDGASAVRTYTSKQIKPLLQNQMTYTFLPQTVSAYSALETFKLLRKDYPQYSYREATLNPTNPTDRATDWEADIVKVFRDNPQKTELVDERDTPVGRELYIARPLAIKDPGCLDCHDTPEHAPRTVIDKYGNANGFGWKLNEVVAAQIITAPMQLPVKRANQVFLVFMLSLAAVFVVMIVAINALLMALVIRPVNHLAQMATDVSLGNLDIPDFHPTGHDEISSLAEAFARMRKSLVKAMKMLEA